MPSLPASRLLALTFLSGSLAACQTVAEPEPAAQMPQLVEISCAGCHAVTAGTLSPNPAAPSFSDLANSPGLTEETLAEFLADAHNYPDQMDVELNAAEAREISRYILTLRDEDYRRVPS